MPGPDRSRRLFELFARPPLGQERVDHPDYANRLADSLRTGIEAELTNPIWMHGRRVQNMFEAMVVAFDSYTLIKTEDAGTLHPEDRYSLPDFQIVLKDGRQILVEVKNCWCAAPHRQRFEMRAADLEKKVRYASAMGIPLKIAIYWARWGVWALIDHSHLVADGATRHIEMLQALPHNETNCIGDQIIGTRAPLTVRLETDRSKERIIGKDGKAAFTCANVLILCEGVALSVLDRDLAMLLVQFGEWQEELAVAQMDGDLVDAVDFNFNPPEPSDQGFDTIGQASRMFARYYSMRTVDDGKVVRVGINLQPGLFRLLTVGDGTGVTLPLWRFHQQPVGSIKTDAA